MDLHIKFQTSSIILTSFRGGNLLPIPAKGTPKSPGRFGFKKKSCLCFKDLYCGRIVFSNEQTCVKLTRTEKKSFGELEKAQEGADTKLILHESTQSTLIYLESTQSTIIIYLPSGDTDIRVLAVVFLNEYKEREFSWTIKDKFRIKFP